MPPIRPGPDVLSILLVLGTITGTVFNGVLTMLMRRRLRKRTGERVFLNLAIAGVIFNFSLLVSVAVQLMVRGRVTWICPAFEAVGFAALGLVPSLLLHTFLAFYRPQWLAGGWWAVLYVPILSVLQPVSAILSNPTTELVESLGRSALPFVTWAMGACLATAFISFALSGEAERERDAEFNETLGWTLVGMALLLLLVAVFTRVGHIPVLGPLTTVVTILSPNVLSMLFAYSVYRYNYLGYVMKAGVFHTVLSSIALSVYFFGIRYIGEVLERTWDLDFRVLEAVLVLGLMFAFEPLRRFAKGLSDRFLFQGYARSRAKLQGLSQELNVAAVPRIPHLMDRVAITLVEVFEAESAGVHLLSEEAAAELSPGGQPLPLDLLAWLRSHPGKVLDIQDVTDPELAQKMHEANLGVLVPMVREPELIGVVVLGPRQVESPLTPEEQDLLLILANQITIVLEKHTIMVQKIDLERQVLETEKLSSLGRLAASVAHEIKNPLSSIKAIVQSAREELGSQPLADDLAVVVEEIDRLDQTTNNLLSFIKPEMNPAKLAPIEGILDGVLEILRYDARKRGVTVVRQFGSENHYVRGRVEDIKSIMFNLVINGLEAMSGGGTLTVRTHTRRQEDGPTALRGRRWAVVGVEDTGVGIPQERLKAIFEPFHSSKESGTGLGLAIVKQKLDDIGGTVDVRSSDHGSCFTVELPIIGRS